ncbi:hypothetical protein DNK47_00345 [Mycoplasma wenyonii]|uniref:Uncharacterized protein n=1 Tax=Mycoplasma wenyonii TaxID=65123 RepID=A0A328PSH8_9MOLU|nr:hypothetical protein [Mycoplasma wenyonii]RAO95297.1 hypothetical protein DNK47_00345 [Mycoplasma wenyonii]
MSWLSFFNSYEIETTAQALIGIGTSCLCFIAIFQHRSVYRTRNTVGFHKGFLLVQLVASAFLVAAGILGMCLEQEGVRSRASFPLLAAGGVLLLLNVYTLWVKFQNLSLAKKAGMSEVEYYEKEIIPSLKLKEET